MSNNFIPFKNKVVEKLLKDFEYSYHIVKASSNKIEITVVNSNGFTASFKMRFSDVVEWIVNTEEFERFNYNSRPAVTFGIYVIKVVWREKK